MNQTSTTRPAYRSKKDIRSYYFYCILYLQACYYLMQNHLWGSFRYQFAPQKPQQQSLLEGLLQSVEWLLQSVIGLLQPPQRNKG